MKKVKFIFSPGYISYNDLTLNKVYDVVEFHIGRAIFWTTVTIINDQGKVLAYDLYDHYYNLLFEDVTHTYRSDVIDEILA